MLMLLGLHFNVIGVLHSFCIWFVFLKKFWSFMFFLWWILFSFGSLFYFVFSSTQSGQNQVVLEPCLVWIFIFLLRFFCFKGVFDKYPLSLFWIVFISRKTVFLTKHSFTKIQKIYIINNKNIFLCVVYNQVS